MYRVLYRPMCIRICPRTGHGQQASLPTGLPANRPWPTGLPANRPPVNRPWPTGLPANRPPCRYLMLAHTFLYTRLCACLCTCPYICLCTDLCTCPCFRLVYMSAHATHRRATRFCRTRHLLMPCSRYAVYRHVCGHVCRHVVSRCV